MHGIIYILSIVVLLLEFYKFPLCHYCRHEFHKKCVDPWLKIKQNCPMCKCSITQTPAPGAPPRNDENDHDGSEMQDRGVAVDEHTGGSDHETSDELNISLRHGGASREGASLHSSGSEDTNSPLLPVSQLTTEPESLAVSTGPSHEEPNVAVLPYFAQVEVNMESLLPSVMSNEGI